MSKSRSPLPILFGLSGFIGLASSLVAGNGSLPTNSSAPAVKASAEVHWLGGKPSYFSGTTFGLPWAAGTHYPGNTTFTAVSGSESVPLQSWVTGQWADGSAKWTAHAIGASDSLADHYTISASSGGQNASSVVKGPLVVTEDSDKISVNTGKIVAVFPKTGNALVTSITTSSGKTVGTNGRLVLQSQSALPDTSDARGDTPITYSNFAGHIANITVSSQASVRALVTVRGTHEAVSGTHKEWLPFVVRFYLYANADSIRILHSIVFDGEANNDFISGLGIRFDVPLAGEELYDRHVRIAGVDGGVLNEAVKGITGLRRDPGVTVRADQVAGKKLANSSTWDSRVTTRLKWIPAWSDYSLSQLSPDGFTLKKRTKGGQGWIKIPGGTRAGGLSYLGGATVGGLAVGLRDFWQRYPSGLDISNAATDVGTITIWLYSPEAQPLDLRPFHDGLGQNGYVDELDALEITYEDYEPGFNTPYGIARTSEISLFAFEATPTSDKLADLTEYTNNPPVLVTSPENLLESKAVGTYWGLPDNSSVASATIESHLDYLVKLYQDQVEDRRWYGFLDHGDFMHTYDPDRHTWRYDIGGYAWDNSELSPDLFFWQQFLRTGREDVYRFAEAMTRHTGEVDVYHIGDWKGLGTRHGVQHWADSAKQARISQPQYRKYFYYLSGGDERIGELLDELLDIDKTYGFLDPQRKVRTDGFKPTPNSTVAFSLGTDLSSLTAAWLIEWERRGSRWEEAQAKLTSTLNGIANLTFGFVTGSVLYDLQDSAISPPPADPTNKGLVAVSHLSAVFGLPEVLSEVIEYYGDALPKGFKQQWLDYCYYYHATKAEQVARYGVAFSTPSLVQAHSRLAAYAANQLGNATVAARAWKDFFASDGLLSSAPWNTTRVDGSKALTAVDEAAWLATNDVAQYGLAAIQNLALIRSALDN